MSVSRSARKKKAALPASISISLKKSSKNKLFQKFEEELRGCTSKVPQKLDWIEESAKPRRKKLRCTESSFYFPEVVEESEMLSEHDPKSPNSSIDEWSADDDCSALSLRGWSTKKSTRNMKLPAVELNDFEQVELTRQSQAKQGISFSVEKSQNSGKNKVQVVKESPAIEEISIQLASQTSSAKKGSNKKRKKLQSDDFKENLTASSKKTLLSARKSKRLMHLKQQDNDGVSSPLNEKHANSKSNFSTPRAADVFQDVSLRLKKKEQSTGKQRSKIELAIGDNAEEMNDPSEEKFSGSEVDTENTGNGKEFSKRIRESGTSFQLRTSKKSIENYKTVENGNSDLDNSPSETDIPQSEEDEINNSASEKRQKKQKNSYVKNNMSRNSLCLEADTAKNHETSVSHNSRISRCSGNSSRLGEKSSDLEVEFNYDIKGPTLRVSSFLEYEAISDQDAKQEKKASMSRRSSMKSTSLKQLDEEMTMQNISEHKASTSCRSKNENRDATELISEVDEEILLQDEDKELTSRRSKNKNRDIMECTSQVDREIPVRGEGFPNQVNSLERSYIQTHNERKKERKRWTLLEDPEARKHFQNQIEKMGEVLSEKYSSSSRRSSRKRWSDELRKKSLSAIEITKIPAIDEVNFKIETDQEKSASRKSRRSRSLNDTSKINSPSMKTDHPSVRFVEHPTFLSNEEIATSPQKRSQRFRNNSSSSLMETSPSEELAKSHQKKTEKFKITSTSNEMELSGTKRLSICLNDTVDKKKKRYPSTPHVKKGISLRTPIEKEDCNSSIEAVTNCVGNIKFSNCLDDTLERKKKRYPSTPHVKKAASSKDSKVEEDCNTAIETISLENQRNSHSSNDTLERGNERFPSTPYGKNASSSRKTQGKQKSHDLSISLNTSISIVNEESLNFQLNKIHYKSTPHVKKSALLRDERPPVGYDSNTSVEDDRNERSSDSIPTGKKRRTYELEESKTDVAVLKSLSEKSSSGASVIVISDDSVELEDHRKVRFQKQITNTNLEQSNTSGRAYSRENLSAKTISSKKPTLLKQAIANNKGKRRSRSLDEVSSSVMRTKMPNFAKIHQRAMDQMENIAQMTERKAERAKLLLSGMRPTANSKNDDSTDVRDKKKSHKRLAFAARQLSASEISLPSAMNERNDTNNKIPTSSQSKTGFLRVAIPQKLKKPKNFLATTNYEHGNPSKIPTTSRENKTAPTSVQEKVKTSKPKNYLDDLKKTHKGPSRMLEQKIAVATKTKPQEDKREKSRTVLKGVRGNRRFELLMKMRGSQAP